MEVVLIEQKGQKNQTHQVKLQIAADSSTDGICWPICRSCVRTLINVSNSSSPRMASCKCLGVIRFTCGQYEAQVGSARWPQCKQKLSCSRSTKHPDVQCCICSVRLTFKSLDALPANSSTSAVRYSAGQAARAWGRDDGNNGGEVCLSAAQGLSAPRLIYAAAKLTKDGSCVDSSGGTNTTICCHASLQARRFVSLNGAGNNGNESIEACAAKDGPSKARHVPHAP